MSEDTNPPCADVARVTSFVTAGVLNTTQQLVQGVMNDIEGAESDLVVEETLCLVATATSRAMTVGLRKEPTAAQVVPSALLELPFTYRDYLIGSAMVAQDAPDLAAQSEEVYERLQRKLQFYTTHLPAGQFPGEHALGDVLPLWMGRVSPPRLPETPDERLEKLDFDAVLLTHLKLALAYGRQGDVPGGGDA